MSPPQLLLLIAIGWLTLAGLVYGVVVPWLSRVPGGSLVAGVLWRSTRLYTKVWHRRKATGVDIIPQKNDGLIVVANHTGALDPLLIQSECEFTIRWMMASDMIGPRLEWLDAHGYVIPVHRIGRDAASLRQAIRHVRGGGALGVFPEGRITIPPREIRPFLAGVGLLVTRTRVPVLLVWVSGTPDTNRMGEAFRSRSHSRVDFVELLDLSDERDPIAIADRLRRRIAEVSGWPLNDEMLPPGGDEPLATPAA